MFCGFMVVGMQRCRATVLGFVDGSGLQASGLLGLQVFMGF